TLARLEAVAQGDTTRPPRRIVCFIDDAEGATYMHRNTLMLRDLAYFCFTTPTGDNLMCKIHARLRKLHAATAQKGYRRCLGQAERSRIADCGAEAEGASVSCW